jgi:hypothetical protein
MMIPGESSSGWHMPCFFLTASEVTMLWTLVAILLILWIIGVAASYTLGGLLHLLLLIALILAAINLFSGRRTV